MEFLNAISGWQWALAGAVPVGIVALYFLKLRRKPLEVPSTFLWKKSIEDLHVNSLWQRLRQSLLLLLQLLAAFAVILALLRPTLNASSAGRRLILVIDNSASMSATDVAPSRLESAKQKAAEIVDQMQQGDAAMVISFSDAARVAASYSENGPALKRAIASIEPTARRTNLREALNIASGLANPQRAGEEDAEAVPATLYLLSDGEFPEISDVPLGNLSMKYLAIGQSRRNVAIVALSARRSDLQPDRLDVFARLHNYAAEPVSATAELLVDGQTVDIQRVEIPAEQDQPMSFRLTNQESAVLTVKLEVQDDFSLDNQAWTVVQPPRQANVLVVGDDNPVLNAALKTSELGKLATIKQAPRSFADQELADNPEADDYDLMIFDRCRPRSMPNCNTYFLGAIPASMGDTPEAVEAPIILNWNSTHPALRFLSLDDVNVLSAFVVPMPRGADQLIESDKGALLFAVPRGVHTDLVQTFALVDGNGRWQTDWPLKVSFPLYIMNVLRALGGVDEQSRQVHRAGDPVTLRSAEDATIAKIERPDGSVTESRRSPQGKFDFLDTEQLGVYRGSIGEGSYPFAVNLFDEAESRIEPVQSIKVGSVEVTDAMSEFAARWELWKPLAVAALILLLLEWHIYNRRVYV